MGDFSYPVIGPVTTKISKPVNKPNPPNRPPGRGPGGTGRGKPSKGVAAPVIEATQLTTTENTTGTINIAAPAGVTEGELLLIVYVISTQSASSVKRITFPAGWNHEMETAGFIFGGVAWKIADGTETGVDITSGISTDDLVARFMRISGHDPDNPIGSMGMTGEKTGSTSYTAPSVISNAPGTLGIWLPVVRGSATTFTYSGTDWIDDGLFSYGDSSVGSRSSLLTKALTPGEDPDFTLTTDLTTNRLCSLALTVNAFEFEETAFSGPVVEASQLSTGDGTTITAVAPSGIQAGELLVIAIANGDAQSGANLSTPTGWTKAGEYGSSGSDAHVAIYYKIATGGEGNVSFTMPIAWAHAAMYYRISGAAASSPLSQLFGFGGTSNGSIEMANPAAPADANTLVIGVMSIDTGAGPVNAWGRTIHFATSDTVAGANGLIAYGFGVGRNSTDGAHGPVRSFMAGTAETYVSMFGAFKSA